MRRLMLAIALFFGFVADVTAQDKACADVKLGYCIGRCAESVGSFCKACEFDVDQFVNHPKSARYEFGTLRKSDVDKQAVPVPPYKFSCPGMEPGARFSVEVYDLRVCRPENSNVSVGHALYTTLTVGEFGEYIESFRIEKIVKECRAHGFRYPTTVNVKVDEAGAATFGLMLSRCMFVARGVETPSSCELRGGKILIQVK